MITQNQFSQAPDSAFCRTKRDEFGLTMPVLIDPSTTVPSTLGVANNNVDIILLDGSRLGLLGHHENEAKIDTTIAEAVAP